jgi:hypothetical protein
MWLSIALLNISICETHIVPQADAWETTLWILYVCYTREGTKDDEILEMVGELCNFIMDEIVYYKGIYHHLASDLDSNP